MFYACKEVPVDHVPPQSRYSVVCLLSSDSELQRVYVYSIFDVNSSTARYESFIRGAIVTVNQQRFTETHNPSNDSYYGLNSPNFITPNNAYALRIAIGQDTIWGSTQSPGSFSITAPAETTSLHLTSSAETLLLQWTPSANAKGYVVDGRTRYGGIVPWVTTDTITSIVIRDTGRYVIKVNAFDESYERHILMGYPSAGLTGAFGFFSTVVVDSVVVNVWR